MNDHNSNSNRPISGETAAWYREFIDQSSDLVQCVDSEGRFTYVNQAWLKTLKYSPEEVTGLTLWQIIHPDSMEHCRTVFEQVVTGKAAGEVEAYFVTKDGAPVAVEGNVSVNLDEEGRFAHTRGIFRNVSARKATEKALRESEEQLSSILNNMTDVVWSISWPDFRHLYLSPALEKLYGRPAREFYANPALFKEVTHPEDRHLTEKAIEQLQANGEAVRECRIVRPDGSIIWINDRSKMIYDENQQPVRVDGVTRDITERKHLEQALSRSEERFQKMLSLVPDLVSIHDSGMNIVYSNWNGFGAVPEEKRILNTRCYKTYRGLDQICPDCRAVKVLQTGETFQKEVELPDGMWVDLRVIPITGEDQTIEFFVEWVGDITDRKESEKELIAQHKLLEGIMDNVSDVLSIQYPDHTIERYNRAGYELLGMTPEEVRGKKCYQLIGRERECEECATGRALQSGKLEQVERYFPELGLHLHCRANPVFEDGKVVLLVQHLMDITHRKEQERKLRDSEQRLNTLISQTPAVIYSFMLVAGIPRVTYVNEKVRDVLGFEPEDFMDNHEFLRECLHPDNVQKVADNLSKLMAEGRVTLEYRFKDKQGNYHWLHDEQKLIAHEDGTMEVVGAWWDITERKDTEKALYNSKIYYESLLNSTHDPLQVVDHNLRIVYANEQFLKKLRELNIDLDVTGKQLSEVFPFLPGRAYEEYYTVLKTGNPIVTEENTGIAGEKYYTETTKSPVFNLDGYVSHIITVIRDITERKRAEEALRESELFLSETQAIAKLGGWKANPRTDTLIWNEGVYDIIEERRDYCPGLAEGIKYYHAEYLPALQMGLKNCIAKGDPFALEAEITTAKGNNRWVEVRAFARSDSKGEPLVMGTIQDITERKKTEQALKLQARERAAVDTFTYSVSNDLQAPLRRIEGFSEALMEECPEQLNEKARGYLTRIITQIGRMKALTDALLQLSNIVSREIDREDVNLSVLVRSNLEKLQYRDPERRVETDLAPELIVEGDADLLNIMLRHLVDNAWKFTSGVQKACIEFGSTEQGGRTVYYLKDNGVGFDMNYADKLFAPFHKLHSEDKYPGIGIGLNLVFRIITRHGGEIWAEGEPGKGACFYFTLP